MTGDARPRVLIVEDEPDMNNLLADVLRAYHFEPLQALSGEQGLALLAERHPDAVLLDVMLPGLSGYEVCKQLKSSRATRPIPVLMLTALDRHLDRQRGFEAGADDYLTKPFTPDGLVEQLQACLDRLRVAGNACHNLVRTLELSASLDNLKTFNALATCLYCHTDLPAEKIEALREGLAQVAEAAGRWAAAHGGLSPARLVVDLDAARLRLSFEPATAEGGAFVAEHLDAEAAVPAALVDAGIVDRITPADGRVVFETAMPPRA